MEIHIAYNIDDNYVKYCAIAITSLFVNNRNEKFHIHIITGGLSPESKTVLREIVEKEYAQQISFYETGYDILKECPAKNISITTYFRCFLTLILPESVSKVIYMDSDTIVCGSIKELWETDIEGYALGGVEDMWSSKKELFVRLGYPEHYSYFNAGVILFNLNFWREHHIQDEIITFIRKNSDKLEHNDQDVLNGVLHNRKKFLPFRYNMQDGFFRQKRKVRKESEPILDAEMDKATIIHFTARKKPWKDNCTHPYKKTYLKYLDMTRWKGERPKIDYGFRFNRFFLIIQEHLGLKNRYRKIKFK